MKLFLGIAVLVAATIMVQADFATYLKEIQTHTSFQKLSTDDKILFSELVMAAETDTTKELIDRVGLLPVLELIDRLSFTDASKFSAYLSESLGYHHHKPSNSDVLTRRSLDKRSDEDSDSSSSEEQDAQGRSNLNKAERTVLDQINAAVQTDSVTEVLAGTDYGTIFGLLENMDETQASQLLSTLTSQLRKANTLVKRDDDDDSGDSSSEESQGRSNLNQAERRVWDEIKAAAETNAVSELLANTDYGAVFGLLENMDETQANELLNTLESQLRKANTLVKRDDDDDSSDSSSEESQGRSNLNQAERKVWDEIKAAAETNAVSELLANTDYGAVFGLLENMDETQANELLNTLESQLRKADAATKVQKREREEENEFSHHLQGHSGYYQSHLNEAERRLWDAMKHASDSNTLTQFVADHGYGVIFGLIENMSVTEANQFMHMLEQQLQKEAAMSG